jgi:prepilin-type processing-associated H-X9-DG protein
MKNLPPEHVRVGVTARRVRGWSLVELLVVCTIGALLVALIVPGISRAIASARAAKCVANLRQLYTAVQAFGNDNNGMLPNSMSAGSLWPQRIAPYLDVKLLPTEVAGAPPCADTPFLCPVAYTDPAPRRSYAFNSRLGDNNLNTDDLPLRINSLSQTVLIGDARNTSWLQSAADLSFRHEGKLAHLLMADGHVEKMDAATAQNRPYAVFIRGGSK